MKRRTAAFIMLLLSMCGTLSAQTVVNRIRLGNAVEDATYISSGVYAKQLVFLDGLNVMGVPANASAAVQPRILFDTTRVPISSLTAPRGLSYVSDTKEFAFTDNLDPYTLYFSDVHGIPTRTLSIQWPDGFAPTNIEAIRWVPGTDSSFPDKFLVVANDQNNGLAYIGVVGRDGKVERVITPSPSPSYITGLAYLSPNRLVIGTADDDSLRLMDLSGNVTTMVSSGHYGTEGIAVTGAHTLLSMYHDGTVIAFSDTLQRLPALDRSYAYGFGFFNLRGIGWDPDLMSFVSWGERIVGAADTYGLFRVDLLGRSGSTITSLDSFAPYLGSTTYLSNEHLIAFVYNTSPRSFLLFDNQGAWVGNVWQNGSFRGPVTYIAPFDQLAMRFLPGTGIRIIDAQTGADVRSIDLTSLGINVFTGMAYFNPKHPTGGEFLLFRAADHTAFVLDFNGQLLHTFDTASTLGLSLSGSVTAIQTSIGCGMFAANDLDRNQIVEFYMPCD